MTDDDGQFEWGFAPEEPVVVEVRAVGYERATRALAPRDEPHRIMLAPPPPAKEDDRFPPGHRRPGYDPFRIFRRLGRRQGVDASVKG